MNEPKHTPSPEPVEEIRLVNTHRVALLDESGEAFLVYTRSKKNAAIIVRAANAYDAFNDFIRGKCPHHCTDGNCPFDRAARQAIAKAEARP